jgi:hypothetical protein
MQITYPPNQMQVVDMMLIYEHNLPQKGLNNKKISPNDEQFA